MGSSAAPHQDGDGDLRSFGAEIRQAFEGMALTFAPEAAGDLEAAIQFQVSGEGGGGWHLDIAKG